MLRILIRFSGGYCGGVTPDPIPNSEVKPSCADGTAGETLWESRSLPDLWAGSPLRDFRPFFYGRIPPGLALFALVLQRCTRECRTPVPSRIRPPVEVVQGESLRDSPFLRWFRDVAFVSARPQDQAGFALRSKSSCPHSVESEGFDDIQPQSRSGPPPIPKPRPERGRPNETGHPGVLSSTEHSSRSPDRDPRLSRSPDRRCGRQTQRNRTPAGLLNRAPRELEPSSEATDSRCSPTSRVRGSRASGWRRGLEGPGACELRNRKGDSPPAQEQD